MKLNFLLFSASPYGRTKRSKWSCEERESVIRFFGDLNTLKKLPSLKLCQEAIIKNPELKNRRPEQLKTWIDNQRKADQRKKVIHTERNEQLRNPFN